MLTSDLRATDPIMPRNCSIKCNKLASWNTAMHMSPTCLCHSFYLKFNKQICILPEETTAAPAEENWSGQK